MDRRFTAAIIIALAVFLSFPKAFADKFNSGLSDDVRNLGMGNAGINTSRGPYSVFYNPANIASKDTGNSFQLVNLQFDAPGGMISGLAGGETGALNIPSLSSLAHVSKNAPNTFEGTMDTMIAPASIRAAGEEDWVTF